jgi:adenylate cyclase
MRQEIATLVEEAQNRAEALLGVIRLLVAVTLAAVLLAATRHLPGEAASMLQRQVALAFAVIGAFALHGLVTLGAARRGRLGPRGRFIAATLDVLFVAANLELNFQNTGLAANWMISLPAIWLLPLLLAHAAIRFDPRLAAWTVGLLMLSLLTVTARAGWDTEALPRPPMVIASFHSLPPMVVRAVMLLLAGAVVIVAVRRGRELLLQGLDAERRRLNLTRYLPPQMAETLGAGDLDALRRGRRQAVALLFVDIRGFTGRAETMAPEALGRFLTEFRKHVIDAADAYRGTVDKFIGDGALLVFGVPERNADDAARALACAEALLATVAAWSARLEAAGEPPVRLTVGVHFGDVFAGVVGDERRLEYTILGDVVNSAQRLQELAREAGFGLLASAALVRAAAADAQPGWRPLPPQPLRGRRDPMAALGRHPQPLP